MKSKLFFTFIASVAMLLTACNEEKESTLDINSIQGRAKIEGKITYNSGDIAQGEGGVKYDNYTALAGKTVYFNMELSSLGDYDGALVYFTTTKEDGTFEIELPANNKGIEYKINVESFKASRTIYDASIPSFVPKNFYFKGMDVESFTAKENIGVYKAIKLNDKEEI